MLKIKFTGINESVPDNIPTVEDNRQFLIVWGGLIESAVHKRNRLFRGEMSQELVVPDAWIEFKEINSSSPEIT